MRAVRDLEAPCARDPGRVRQQRSWRVTGPWEGVYLGPSLAHYHRCLEGHPALGLCRPCRILEVWVVDQLAIPYFLGNAFLHPHRIDISARKQCLDIEVLDVLEILTRIIHEGRPVTRRAAATAVTAIPPGQTRVIAARSKDLPKGRVFVSDPIHPAAAAVFVDADTPRVIQMTNPTKEAIRIGKDARLGQIRDNEGIDMLSATGVTLAAAAVTGQLTGLSTAPARSDVPVGDNPSLDLDPNPGPVEVDYGDLSDDPSTMSSS